MTYEVLVHELGCENSHTTWELLDVTTKYATDEEVVQANFSSKAKATGHLSDGDGGDNSASAQHCHDKRAKD